MISIKRFLEMSDLVRIDEGLTLTEENKTVDSLLYIADGVVKVERAGRIVAVCGPGDYVGELSYLSGDPATATVTAVKPVRALAFQQDRLRTAVAADPALRPSRLRARNVAWDRVVEGRCARVRPRRESRAACRRVVAEVVPARGGLSLTPARLALDRPMAMACLVERAP